MDQYETTTGELIDMYQINTDQAAADAAMNNPEWVKAQVGAVADYGTNMVSGTYAASSPDYTGFAGSLAGSFGAMDAARNDEYEYNQTEWGPEELDKVKEQAGEYVHYMQQMYAALEEEAYTYGDQMALLAVQMGDSVYSFDNYVDAVTGIDVSLEQSSAMMDLASQAAWGNSDAFFELTSMLEAQGMSASEASVAASQMVAVLGQQGIASITVSDAIATTSDALTKFGGTMVEVGSMAADAAATAASAASSAVSYSRSAEQAVKNFAQNTNSQSVLDSYADGTNYVPQTGLYQLHEGEAVIPANQNTGTGGAVNVKVYIGTKEIKNDIRVVADELITDKAQRGVTDRLVAM
jgi:hypothetical protein